MKAIKFLSVALVALTLFSCSRDEAVTPGNGEPGEPTLVTVKLTGGNYLAVVTSQYFLFKNLIKGYHKSLVFLRI